MSNERVYYPVVKEWLEGLLTQRFGWCYLEITARRRFSNEIKAHIPRGREIIFQFLKQTAPDITGFVDRAKGSGFIIVDMKTKIITLQDVYQVKRYAELFGAQWGLLLSTAPIPEEFRRLREVVPVVYSTLTGHGEITLGFLREEGEKLTVEWFPADPFAKTLLHRIMLG